MKKNIVIAGLSVLLCLSVVLGLRLWKTDSDEKRDLQNRLTELEAQEERSAVLKGVSKRMEEIAFEQKQVSDMRREKAIEQAIIAQEMSQRALKAQAEAKASEKAAIEAYDTAEMQRQIAEQQRLQAEYSKHVADTLSYIALGRSLGLRSYSLYQAGKTELSNLLAYAAYDYTKAYGGDLYNSSIYRALSLNSKSMNVIDIQDGAVFRIVPDQHKNLITISILGEINLHEINGGKVNNKCLFKDSRFKFKDVYVAKDGSIFAVSRTGYVVIVGEGAPKIVEMQNMVRPNFLSPMKDGRHLLIVGLDGMAVMDLKTCQITDQRPIDFEVTCVSSLNGHPLLFDNRGRMHEVRNLQQFDTRKVPVKGEVTAFAYSAALGLSAYGTKDGNITVVDNSGRSEQLVAHRSRVSQIMIDGTSLYSSSYDGTLNLWMLTGLKVEPIELISSIGWIHDFTIGEKKDYLWASTANGSVVEHLISVNAMANRVRQHLKRDFTTDEWDYYIGSNIPFRSFMKEKTR